MSDTARFYVRAFRARKDQRPLGRKPSRKRSQQVGAIPKIERTVRKRGMAPPDTMNEVEGFLHVCLCSAFTTGQIENVESTR